MKSLIVIALLVVVSEAQQISKVLIYDSTNCLYNAKNSPATIYSEKEDVPNYLIPVGTITFDYRRLSIGQDWVTASEIAAQKAAKAGAGAIIAVSANKYADTKDIATITFRMYSFPCWLYDSIVPDK